MNYNIEIALGLSVLLAFIVFFAYLKNKTYIKELQSNYKQKQTIYEENTSKNEQKIQRLTNENQNLKISQATLSTKLQEQTKAYEQRLNELNLSKENIQEYFKTISLQNLEQNADSFLRLANEKFQKFQKSSSDELTHKNEQIKNTLEPIKESIQAFNDKIKKLEDNRIQSFTSLKEQLNNVNKAQKNLANQTQNLTNALRKPDVRGRWGELQLKKVVELAGMTQYCDFIEQASSEDNKFRPDMIVKLPNNKNIIIDSKTPLISYLEAIECDDEESKTLKLQQHTKALKEHIRLLGSKAYHSKFENSPEFVVLFLPGENFYSSALTQDPNLIEYAINEEIIIATPTTLISLLKAVAYGWNQEDISQNAKKIQQLGSELYDRINIFKGHFDKMHQALNNASIHYNKASKSLESRVLVSARKFQTLDNSNSKELSESKKLENIISEE